MISRRVIHTDLPEALVARGRLEDSLSSSMIFHYPTKEVIRDKSGIDVPYYLLHVTEESDLFGEMG